MKREAKIVMIAMFKNEASVLRTMLDSVVGHIDYYVMQDNGSTDGSPDIVKDWAETNNIPGVLYKCEEGWKGFGWNRDHLIRYCQNEVDHGCDWILKMDCDEILDVDPNFDFSLFNDTSLHAFNIPAVQGTGVYYRTWMWNAKLPWAFNHDPCHETIYCLLPEIDHNYRARDLPIGFNQTGFNTGESWSVPTKFISDALILEEKLIREQNLLENMYHFWYIGKSYRDAMESSAFPLGKAQADEYARRSIWYLNKYIDTTFKNRNGNIGIDEMCYMAMIMEGECYVFQDLPYEAIIAFKNAEQFAPKRNDHLIYMCSLYKQTEQYKELLNVTTRLIDPERTFPFPEYCNFVDRDHYVDGPNGTVQRLHKEAQMLNGLKLEQDVEPTQVIKEPKMDTNFILNNNQKKRLFIVDNYYADPYAVREFALSQVNFKEDIRWYKGHRSDTTFRPEWIRRSFEDIIGENITDWEQDMNGVFQVTTSKDLQVYHYDEQKWAAMIYLTPNAPLSSGTRQHISKINGAYHSMESPDVDAAFDGDFYDSTKFDTAADVGNVFNRLVIMDAQHIHSAGNYFGTDMDTGRLTHLFFFD